MCYSMYLATDSTHRFQDDAHERLPFETDLGEEHEEALKLLSLPKLWFITREFGGCSCEFRHRMERVPPYFCEPEDWFPEDEDNIEASQALYDVLVRLLATGSRVELMYLWSAARPDAVLILDVDLAEVSRDEFLCVENTMFRFSMTT